VSRWSWYRTELGAEHLLHFNLVITSPAFCRNSGKNTRTIYLSKGTRTKVHEGARPTPQILHRINATQISSIVCNVVYHQFHLPTAPIPRNLVT